MFYKGGFYDNRKPTINIPYNNFPQDYIKPILRSKNINVTHKSGNTRRSTLVNNRGQKPPFEPRRGAGVYVIPCENCDQCYVGETGRDFQVRLREHKQYVRLGNENSAVFNHIFRKKHSVNWNSSQLVYHSQNRCNRLVVESTLIKHLSNFNNAPGVNSIDNLTKSIILSVNRNIINNLPTCLS